MQSNRSVAIIAVSLAWFFYLFSYVARIEPCVLINNLMTDFQMTSSTVGMVISVMYIPYVIFQIPCGIMTDRLGIRKMITACCLLCAVGMFVFASATSILQLQIGRFLIGAASASSFLCCGKAASDYFAPEKYATLTGIAMAMGCLGGIAGTSPTALLVSHLGWRNATYAIAVLGVIVSIAAFTLVRDKIKKKQLHDNKLLDGLKILVRNPKSWLIGFYGLITFLPLSAIAELWGVPFTELKYGVSTQKAAIVSIFIFVGFGIGGIVSAYISEKIGSYKKTIVAFTILLLGFTLFVLYSDGISFMAYMMLMLFVGIFAGANTLAFTLVYNIVPKEFAGTSVGYINTMIMSSGIIFQPLLGKLLDFFRGGAIDASGNPVYSVEMYRSAFIIVIVGMVLAGISTFFLKDPDKNTTTA